MLKNLHIKNIALVDKQEIDFFNGLNIITGETGAGKSVIMGCMRLLMGQRAEKSLIRSGEEKAEMSAILNIPKKLDDSVSKLLEAQDIEPEEDGEIILRRVISRSGSRNFINGSSVPLQILRELGEQFIDIFSAGEQHSLVDSDQQLSILDRYASVKSTLINVESAYKKWRKLESDLEKLSESVPSAGELEILQYQFNEIKDANINSEEESEIYDLFANASSGHERIEIVQQLNFLLENDENTGCISAMRRALSCFQDLARLDKAGTAEYSQRFESIIAELCDLSMDIENYASEITIDPGELARLEERMRIYNSLKKKYGPEVEDIIKYCDEISIKIELAANFKEQINSLKSQIKIAEENFIRLAIQLRNKRKLAAVKLSSCIAEELKELEFLNSEFEITIKESNPSSKGMDKIEFRFSPNKGEELKLLRDIASSGEISRVMLAVKSILARVDAIPILIFDEIDANIGGITASKIAKKLHQLGSDRQLFCVTHLPQVAAAGHYHFQVNKVEHEGRSISTITQLSDNNKINEIGRMLGGSESSSLVYEHAKELTSSILK